MSPQGSQILRCLQEVSSLRGQRAVDPVLARRVRRIKTFQQLRFRQTYADMLEHPRYAAATRYFLSELYGPDDFAQRDEEFARVVPALVRLFAPDVVGTVEALATLHALSERLDSEMAQAIDDTALDAMVYARAWRATGQADAREQQVSLMLAVGLALDGLTRKALLRHSLRMMRGPAQAAGLGSLQHFLETGFETFRAMAGAAPFLDTVATRERTLAAALFADTAGWCAPTVP